MDAKTIGLCVLIIVATGVVSAGGSIMTLYLLSHGAMVF